jgi:hypothetical protein
MSQDIVDNVSKHRRRARSSWRLADRLALRCWSEPHIPFLKQLPKRVLLYQASSPDDLAGRRVDVVAEADGSTLRGTPGTVVAGAHRAAVDAARELLVCAPDRPRDRRIALLPRVPRGRPEAADLACPQRRHRPRTGVLRAVGRDVYRIRLPFFDAATTVGDPFEGVPPQWDWIVDDGRRRQHEQTSLFRGFTRYYEMSDAALHARLGRGYAGGEPPAYQADHQLLCNCPSGTGKPRGAWSTA